MTMTCEGCGERFVNVFDNKRVCMDCVRARARAATTGGRCKCGRKRREREVSNGARRWIACDRCLGSVRQVA